jgi:hypothetical protein
MKSTKLAVTFLSAIAFTVGCDKPETTSQKLDALQQKTAAAAEDMKDYTFAQKAEFTAKMQGQLTEINRDLETLAAKIEKSSDAVKAEAKPKLEALRADASGLERQLEEAKNATESTWESVKTTSRKAFADFKEGVTVARQWVSEKIAP